MNLPYTLISDKKQLKLSEPIIEYSRTKTMVDALFVPSRGILEATHLEKLSFYKKGSKIYFENNDANSTSENQDLFGLVFYFISRYEEHLPYTKDIHGRFPSTQSILHHFDLIHLPVVDLIIYDFIREIETRFSISIPKKTSPHTMTMDIDHAWLYTHKSKVVNIGSGIKYLIKGKLDWLKDQLSICFGSMKDPYDLENLIRKYKLKKVKYFFLLATRSRYDKGHNPQNLALRQLIQKISSQNEIGIHPSYLSNTNDDILKDEILKLETILEKKIIKSRQHYLKLNISKTYPSLLNHGIHHDYSMGFADTIGYRSGTGYSHYYYDFSKEKATSLMITPFQIMDVTLKNKLGLSPEAAFEKCKKMIEIADDLQSPIHIIWHNSSFYDKTGWSGWEKVFEYLYAQCN